MLRKDVKIGFVVGGILIATLIAYVVVAGRGKPRGVEFAEGDGPLQVQPVGSEEPLATASQSDAPKPVPAEPDPAVPSQAKPTDPFQPSNNTRDVWAAALNSGTVLMSVTPSAPQTPIEPAVANIAASTPDAKVTETISPSLLPPTTQPAEVKTGDTQQGQPTPLRASRTHVIQKGETLTMVAVAVYGDQKYWKQIAAANPSLNPNKLKPGVTVALPDIASKKEHITAALNGGVVTAVDTKKQYQVQSGDSLRRIAVRLYGKEAMWEKIYELNKATIGADPAKLKLHTVLKLPQTPPRA